MTFFDKLKDKLIVSHTDPKTVQGTIKLTEDDRKLARKTLGLKAADTSRENAWFKTKAYNYCEGQGVTVNCTVNVETLIVRTKTGGDGSLTMPGSRDPLT